ncbi:MAG: 5-dehydro-4-deoxy-D-glucuronate isomerase [Gammaproteobacteria bacterium]|nr:5-dehydro-4-deoxy-D-glucuronate isomerase [Gammaproteobacteria bacterium]
MNLEVRYSTHPDDSKHYTTEELRKHYLIKKIFVPGEVNLTYSHNDRIIAGGAMPLDIPLELESGKELASAYFLELREMGVINIGAPGYLLLDGVKYDMNFQDGIYISRGTKDVKFCSCDPKNPAKFYINSCPAHKEYPTTHIPLAKANKRHLGDPKNLNVRTINQYVHPAVCKSCQLCMGMTILEEGSVWNTMPCHTHARRMEVYLYFNITEDDFVLHLMGEPNETRHILVHNEQAVISPSWSIHSGCATKNYTFIWGMCGENQTFDDMDNIENKDLR